MLMVGAGGIAQAHARAVWETADIALAGVVDVRAAAAEALAESHGCRAFATLEEALAATAPDAALVCTPPNTHEALAVACLAAGAHVLCEKPFAPDRPAAERMVAAAARAGKLLTMASKFRYVPDLVRAKAALAGGVIGEPVAAFNSFTARVDMTRRWNADPAVAGGGVVMDNGTHSADIVRYLLGPVSAVRADRAAQIQPCPVEDSAWLGLRVGEVLANVELSWSSNAERDHYVVVCGSAGAIQIGWKASRIKTAHAAEWQPLGLGYDKHVAFRAQLENFAGAIVGREPLRIGPEDAVASVAAIDAAYRSLAAGGAWQDVAP
jgi:predicted dehydrogenase